MLRKLLTNAMACLITLHAVLGCCWHHAHGNEHAAADGATVVAHTECDHCHPGDDHASPEKPQKCRTECRVCTFLPSQKTQLEAPPMTVALDWVIVAEGVPPTSSFATINNSSRQRSEPPLRLHLLHQLLLI